MRIRETRATRKSRERERWLQDAAITVKLVRPLFFPNCVGTKDRKDRQRDGEREREREGVLECWSAIVQAMS